MTMADVLHLILTNPCRFYDAAEKALEDMKQLAVAEAQDNQRGEK